LADSFIQSQNNRPTFLRVEINNTHNQCSTTKVTEKQRNQF